MGRDLLLILVLSRLTLLVRGEGGEHSAEWRLGEERTVLTPVSSRCLPFSALIAFVVHNRMLSVQQTAISCMMKWEDLEGSDRGVSEMSRNLRGVTEEINEEPQDSCVLTGGQTGHLSNTYRACVISGFSCVVTSPLFWDVTQRRLIVTYRRFGTACLSYLKRSSSLVQSSWTTLLLKMRSIGYPETSVIISGRCVTSRKSKYLK